MLVSQSCKKRNFWSNCK